MHKLLKAVDSYKLSHFKMYPPNIKYVESYIETRGFSAPFITEPEVVMFGMKSYIKDYLSVPLTHADIDAFKPMIMAHGLPFNEEGFRRVVDVHKGFMPVDIEALPEGSLAPLHVPLIQLRNTDKNLPWVASYIETSLLRSIWYPTTVATLSREAKKIINQYLKQNADTSDGLNFKLHDFGARGATSQEQAELGGMAHLINFRGTDTVEAIFKVPQLYNLNGPAGFSIPATEHSISTMYGKNHEYEYADMIVSMIEAGAPLAAIVSDTYDLYNFIRNILGTVLKERILKLKGTLVVRPDSGNPVEVTLNVIELLGDIFGYTINSKGYKVLPNCIRIIQGDGINLSMIHQILAVYDANGWSADNIAFGMGGGLLQQVNRDSLKFAQKANEAIEIIDEDWNIIPLQKNPATDPGKASKAGHQIVHMKNGQMVSTTHDPVVFIGPSLLETAYSMQEGLGIIDGATNDFDKIRKRAEIK